MKKKHLKFVKSKFNEEQVKDIVDYYEKEMKRILDIEVNFLTKNQYKAARKTVLPKIILYKAFIRHIDSELAKSYGKEILEFESDGFRKFTNFMTNSNFRIQIFKKLFKKILKSDVWDSTIKEYNKKCFNFNMDRCLYSDLCNKYDASEFCTVYCQGDYFVFGGMNKLKFERSQTIGEGGEVCDFHFINQ